MIARWLLRRSRDLSNYREADKRHPCLSKSSHGLVLSFVQMLMARAGISALQATAFTYGNVTNGISKVTITVLRKVQKNGPGPGTFSNRSNTHRPDSFMTSSSAYRTWVPVAALRFTNNLINYSLHHPRSQRSAFSICFARRIRTAIQSSSAEWLTGYPLGFITCQASKKQDLKTTRFGQS